jgi:KaiC/GvpD/RAD55 family RecA-like ATPase
MARELMVVKTRGSDHEKRVTAFEITGKGMVVHA